MYHLICVFFLRFIYLFIFSQANTNEIVLASTHDVQEVDVSTLLAAQPYTWIGEEFDKESRRFVICLWVFKSFSSQIWRDCWHLVFSV